MLTPLSISDVEAEALLSGADGGRNELAAVAEVLAVVKAAGQAEVGQDFSHLIAPAALESRATPLSRFAEEQALARRNMASRVASRVAIGAAALFMLVVSTTGLAFAANGSKPGDLLYGLDRAAEVIGIGNGGAAERFAEAQGLAAAGSPGGGLAHAAAVLSENEATQTAGQAVAAAAVRLQQEPQGASGEAAAQIDQLLGYLATTPPGEVNGQDVSDRARQIGGPPGGAAPGNSESAPGHTEDEEGAEEEAPGNSENAPGHDPDGPSNSENAPGHTEDEEGAEEEAPGNSENAPGHTEDEEGAEEEAPGNSENAPGHTEDPPGPPSSIPGQGTPGGTQP